MGGGSSRRKKQPSVPIPTYNPGSPGISRPGAPLNTGMVGSGPLNRDQQRELMMLNQQVANLNTQIQNLQRGGAPGGFPMPYSNYPALGGMPPPVPYGSPSMPYGTPPPSPFLQRMGGGYPYGSPGGSAVYRDTDFAAIANIAGLNPADIAILHREFLNLTRGGTGKIDRSVFRQLLRDVLLQANNEHVDRTIENMFVTIDRNRDGFIDFPEFVGAFKDVLKQNPSDPQSYLMNHAYPDVLSEQLRASGVGSGIAVEPLAYVQQQASPTQFVTTGGLNMVPLASTGMQQTPVVLGGGGGGGAMVAPFQITDANAPMLTLDPNQSSYVIATPGQYLITQPTALQCVPLPML